MELSLSGRIIGKIDSTSRTRQLNECGVSESGNATVSDVTVTALVTDQIQRQIQTSKKGA